MSASPPSHHAARQRAALMVGFDERSALGLRMDFLLVQTGR